MVLVKDKTNKPAYKIIQMAYRLMHVFHRTQSRSHIIIVDEPVHLLA